MPRNSRCVLPDLPYHITKRETNRQTVFHSAADRRTYLGLVRENLSDAGIRVLAYCLMTNHVHWLVVPEREDSLATLFRRVHGRYAQAFNARRARTGHLWQNRFFSCPLSGQHLWIALRYIEQNPVRALLAASPEDYSWSSARVHLTGDRDRTGILDMRFWERAGGVETWRAMHAAAEDWRSTQLLRRCTYAGRPFGPEDFVERLESQFARKWRRWGFESPQSSSTAA
jgi:putative transposase